MKIIKNALLLAMILMIIIFIAGFIIIRYVSHKSIPDYNADVTLTGLSANVEVFRDEFAIPHVYAETEKDLYMAVGYLMAQDRLWQMDFLRRVTLGRLSEIFGENYANTDLILRSLRYSDKSRSLLGTSDTAIIEALEAFSDGVNEYIHSHSRKLPFEFTLLGYKPEPWEPLHSLNLIGFMAWDLKAGWSEYILEEIRGKVDSTHFAGLLPEIGLYKTFVYPGFDSVMHSLSIGPGLSELSGLLGKMGADVFDGSNNWAVSAKKSSTGSPIMANDMHLGLNVPGIWYQMHQCVKGRLNVTGLVLPGQPLVICGHNENIAWGMTNTYVDNLDFYLERINPEDSNQYLYKDEWKDFTIKEEKIATKNGDTLTRYQRYNHRGPVISEFKDIKDKIVTMHWVGDEQSNEMKTIYQLNRATNWDDFRNALKTFRSISQNIVYADKEGNIGLFCAAGIPIRKRVEVYGILPGWTDEFDWQGMVPFDELPFSYNPECGFVSSANNKTVDDNYPYHISNWFDVTYRIDRIREMLSSKEKLSVEDFKNIQLDQETKMKELILPELLQSADTVSNLSELEQRSLALLKEWNGDMHKDRPEPAIFENYYHTLLKNIYADELGNKLFERLNGITSITRTAVYRIFTTGESVWIDDITTGYKESLADICLRSFKESVEDLGQEYGGEPDSWKWGEIHQLTLAHPLSSKKILDRVFNLNRGPFKVGGSFHTVSPYSYPPSDPKLVNHGSSHRHIYTAGNWDHSLTVIPTGNSGIPASKHYCDQTGLYIGGNYHEDHFSKNAVTKNVVYKMTFKAADR
ncbi:MAG: penicillin acylase family protein [Bacteroidales bacterium]|nr:penicillin acylase family protein [Bacteroidales bacterium]